MKQHYLRLYLLQIIDMMMLLNTSHQIHLFGASICQTEENDVPKFLEDFDWYSYIFINVCVIFEIS